MNEQRNEAVTESDATGKTVPSHPPAPVTTILSVNTTLVAVFSLQEMSQQRKTPPSHLEVHLFSPCFFIAEDTRSSEASEGGTYFGPKQKRVGDAVGRDS